MDNIITSKQIDIFKEVGSIGSGNAATALSQLINKPVLINLIKTELIHIEDVPEEIGGAEKMVLATYQTVMGDLFGDAVYLHQKDYVLKLINFITGIEGDLEREPTADDISAYKEMANIFTGSYMNAISKMLDISIIPSVPYYACDMLGSVIDMILAKLGQQIDTILLLKTEISIDNKDIGGGYLMIFNPDSMKKLTDIIKEKFGIDGS